MYAQNVRKWSLKTKLMPLISLVFYVSNMLLLITCMPTTTTVTTTAAAAVTLAAAVPATQQQQHQQRPQYSLDQRLWHGFAIASSASSNDNIGAVASASAAAATPTANGVEEESYYITVDNGRGSSESDYSSRNSNSNNIYLSEPARQASASSRSSSSSSSSSSSNSLNSNKLKPATVFATYVSQAAGYESGSIAAAQDIAAAQQQLQQQQQQQQQQQHVAATGQSMQKVPNMLTNSQINKLFLNGKQQAQSSNSNSYSNNINSNNKVRRHILPTLQLQPQPQLQLQQQQQHAASNSSYKPQRYLIESYEVPDTLPVSSGHALTQAQRALLQQAARNRRDFSNSNSQQPFQQLQQQHRAQQQYDAHAHKQQHAHNQHKGGGRGGGRRRNRNQRRRLHKHGRKRAGRYCSARDPGQLAFEAPTVFEGKIISMTPDRRVNFSATLEVKTVYKQQFGFHLPKYVRLQFALRNNSGECDIYRERLLPRGLVRGDDLEPAVTYMTFVQQKDLGNFTILGQPIRVTQTVIDAVKTAVSENYTQFASITSIRASNKTMENGKELHIICEVEGRPPPKVTWFKDNKSINSKRNLYQFKHHKRRSELIVRSFNSSDAGFYECRAKNKVRKKIEKRKILINAYPVATRPDPTRNSGHPCPENVGFCFHDGTCKLIPELNSFYCNCPDGFVGERCESKVNSVPESRYSNNPECGDNKFFGGFYC